MTDDICRIGYPKSQAWILKELPLTFDFIPTWVGDNSW